MRQAAGGAPRTRATLTVALFALAPAIILSAACGGSARPATAPETPRTRVGDHETGDASWYGPDYHGKTTASGERYNMFDLTAAHRTLPFGTMVRVENIENRRSVVVRINDRGPFVRGRIIDLSYTAAREIEFSRGGTVRVRIEVVAVPGEAHASEGVDSKDILKDPIGVVSLADEDALGIVDLHVRKGGDAELPNHRRLPIHDVDLANGDIGPL